MTAVDVVILTWNDDPSELQTAVDSAVRQTGSMLDVRVIVVDNGSDVPPIVPAYDSVTVVRSETNLGVGGGRNLGVSRGHAPVVCVLDSDARLHAGALEQLVAPLRDDARVGLTAPVFSGQLPQASAGRAPTVWRKVLRATNRTDLYELTPGQGAGVAWDVDFAIGACQVIRREAFDEIGGLDASATFGPEDVDFCLRLWAAGWTVRQVAHAGCDHPPRRAFKGLATRRGLLHALAVARHLWKHRGARAEVVG